MKKKIIILLSFICILSLCVFSGLMVYAFHLQAKKDLQENKINQENQVGLKDTTTVNNITASPTEAVPGTDTSSSDLTLTPGEASSENTTVDTSPDTASTTPIPSVTPAAKDTDLSESEPSASESIILGFAGDVNLNETSYPIEKYDLEGKDISACLSEDLLNEMNSANIMMLNNEFAYSTRGVQAPDKSYTFRADPSRVEILSKMGVDIVSLANNHALDYGPDALMDTFATLEGAGINYVGAGENLDRAKAPIYFNVGDKTIAYVSASRVVFKMNWYASEDGLGMIGTYDPTLILESIREAKANSDYVVAFVHWGVERSNYPKDYQRTLATKYIDAGADAVIGCHPHVMQGFELYKGKPIAYSLGNFWFNNSTKKSGMLKLYLNQDDTVSVQLLPAMNKETFTYLLTDETEKANYYDFIEGLSYGVKIDAEGFITGTE